MNENANANSTIESHIECHLRISKRKIYGKSKITQPSSCWLRADGGDGMPSSCTFMRCRLHILLMLAHLSVVQYFHSHYAAILICVRMFCLSGMEKNAFRLKTLHATCAQMFRSYNTDREPDEYLRLLLPCPALPSHTIIHGIKSCQHNYTK